MLAWSQVEAIQDLFSSGRYVPCIRKAEKLIDKQPRNLEAYLLKAQCLCEGEIKQPDEEDLNRGVERSMVVIKTLQRLDKDKSFLSAHSAEVAGIQRAARQKLAQYVVQEKCALAKSLTDNLIALFDDPAGWYYKGKCLLTTEEEEASDCMEKACTKMFSRWKSGEIAEPYLQEAFADFAALLVQANRPQSARDVILHAEEMFGDDPIIADAGVSMLSTCLEGFNESSGATEIKTWLDFANLLHQFHPTHNRLSELKLSIASSYLNALSVESTDMDIAKLITDTLNGDPSRLQPTLRMLEDLLSGLTLKDVESLMATEGYRWKLAGAYSELLSKHGVSPADAVNRMVESGRLLHGLILGYYLERLSNDTKLEATSKEVLNELVKPGPPDKELLKRLRQLSRIRITFRDELALDESVVSLATQLTEEFLDRDDFSNAGVTIRLAHGIAPQSLEVNELYTRWVKEDYDKNFMGSMLMADELAWTGSTTSCDPGTVSRSSNDKCLQRLNYYRRLAGIPDSCTWNEEWNAASQAAALCMYANYSLSHAPPKSWKCYSDLAYKGASSCNLSLGEFGPQAITGQVEDSGDNNKVVGHRRYILNPYKKEFAIGNTPRSMALYVFGKTWDDSITAEYEGQPVCWPPAGYVPTDLVYRRWHFSLSGYDFSKAEIKMSRNGEPMDLEINPGSYGTIIWEPRLTWPMMAEEAIYVVEIIGAACTSCSEPQNFRYEVKSVAVR
jgi:hypothetical protein